LHFIVIAVGLGHQPVGAPKTAASLNAKIMSSAAGRGSH
jgi:hypothetical protein